MELGKFEQKTVLGDKFLEWLMQLTALERSKEKKKAASSGKFKRSNLEVRFRSSTIVELDAIAGLLIVVHDDSKTGQ